MNYCKLIKNNRRLKRMVGDCLGLNFIQKSKDKELKQLTTKLLEEEKVQDTKYTQSLFIKNN